MIDYMYIVSPKNIVIKFQTWWIRACGVEVKFLLSWFVDVILLQQEIKITTYLVVHWYYKNVLKTSKCFAKEIRKIHD
jgi:hypothetical protein